MSEWLLVCVGEFAASRYPVLSLDCLWLFSMANVSPFMSPGHMSQVFFPPGGPSPPGPVVVQQGTPVSVHNSQTPGFPTVDMGVALGPGGASGMTSGPPAPAGVSFMIQIGLSRESVLLPQTADLAYVKQISCSIVDQKVSTTQYVVLWCCMH